MMPPPPPESKRFYCLSAATQLTPGHNTPHIVGMMTWDETLAYDHARRGGLVRVDWDLADSFTESDADVEQTRAWSLREYPEK